MSLQALFAVGTVAVNPCEHCGSLRMRTNLRQLRQALSDEPTPLLAQLVRELAGFYGNLVPIFTCSSCGCVTGDSRSHSH